ncbi:MAG: hypothetical protein OEM40_10050 [Acidimicrobiia bacterium]|nr:hypothetical protein [Acidimicrobiia bacterium]
MAEHTCTNCGATFSNEEFCPSCGQWVADESFEEFDLTEPETYQSLPYDSTPCPSCGAANPLTNRHCEECGARLSQGALPVAPQPMIQTTAGVRAAMAIGTLLVIVVVAALIFNGLGGDDTATTTLPIDDTSTSNTVATQAPREQIVPISVNCSSFLNGWPCENMFDADPTTDWNDDGLSGEGAVIRVTFPASYQLEQIIIKNVDDDTRFRRNFRIASYKVTTDDNAQGAVGLIPDEPGAHIIDFSSLATTQVTIEIQSVHQAEDITVTADDGTTSTLAKFDELVIQEIEFYGRQSG